MAARNIPTPWEAMCLFFIRNGAHQIAWNVMTAHGRPIPVRLIRKGWAQDTGRRFVSRGGSEVMVLALTEKGSRVLTRYQRERNAKVS